MADEADSTQDKEWRPVLGFEGLYEVSSCGSIRSLQRIDRTKSRCGNLYTRTLSSVLLKPALIHGYRYVILRKDGKSVNKKVSRMLCEAFHGPSVKGMQAAHLNNVRDDDRVDNLIWATNKENSAHKLIHGTQPMGETSPNAKITEKQVKDARARHARGESFGSIARSFGVGRKTISRAVYRETWKHVA